MERTVLNELINNAALLLVLSVIFEVTYLLPSRYSRVQSVFSGLMVAVICVAIMLMPFTLMPGLVYDTRSILISVTALIFGPVPTVITAVAAVIYRLSAGGVGTLPGVSVILSSALIGLAWRRWVHVKSRKLQWLNVLLMSITVHITMLACMLLLPYPDSLTVIQRIAMPVMIVYPFASVLLSLLLLRQLKFKNIQSQLKKSEERFRALFNKAPLGYQSLDIDGNFIDVNQQWLDTLGYSRDEVVGKWFGDFLLPAYREAFRLRFPLFKAQGQIHSEFGMLHKSGEEVFVSFEGKIAYDTNGNVKQTHCILQDITKQRAAEEELRVSEEKYRRLYETMAQGIVYQAADGSIISANPAAERVLGLTLDQMHGRTSMDPRWKSIREDGSEVAGSDHPAMVALHTGKPYGPFVMGIFQPQINDHVWLSINAIPIFRQGEKEPYQVYATFQDITAERKANQNYQQLFREMIDAFALHEIICDDQGKPVNYRFLSVNPAFEHMTGLKSEDIVGNTVMEVLPDVEPYWIEIFGKVALTGEPVRFENYNISSDKHFEVSAYQPSPNQFACTFSDVTKRVWAEAEKGKILSRLRSLLDNSPSPIVIINENGSIVEESAVAKKILGLPEEVVSGEDTPQTAPPVIQEKVLQILSQSPGNGQFLEGIDVFEFKGNRRHFESRLFPIHNPDQNERLFGYLAIDVTDRILAEHALKESEEKYSSYIENAPYGIFVANKRGQYVEVNRFGLELTGYSEEQFKKMSISDITAEESLESAMYKFEELKSSGYMRTELKYIHGDGSIRWWTVDAVKLSEDRYLCFSIDITEKKAQIDKIEYLSYHDPLTGLYNRRFFEEEFRRLDTERNLPLSIIMGDVNDLKLTNDVFGHTSGDELLNKAAEVLKNTCRADDIIARWGGDEFVILLPKTSVDETEKLIARIKNEFAGEQIQAIKVSMSLGCDAKQNTVDDIMHVLNRAEGKMYQSKTLEWEKVRSEAISAIITTLHRNSTREKDHSQSVSELCQELGRALDLDEVEILKLKEAGFLHDIGKVVLAPRLLNESNQLNSQEWDEMRVHPTIGYRILSTLDDTMDLAKAVLAHHEHWDGSGYPKGLKEDEIPLTARIIAVVESYDRMVNRANVERAVERREAIEELKSNAGNKYEPAVVAAFIQMMEKSEQ
jgi:diguanylate cyclase (GGDEF)-like protein/PAS domain S-box-containing protein